MAESRLQLSNKFALVNKAVDWWLTEIREVLSLPFRFRKTAKVEFTVSHNESPQISAGASLIQPGAWRHIRLNFADNALLYRKIKLPAAATKNINSVIGYEFNKYFPMDAKDAIYSFRILQPVMRSESVEVEIWAVSREAIEDIIADIRSTHSIQVRTLTISNDEDQDVLLYDILKERKADGSAESQRNHRVFNLVIIALLAGVILYPLFKLDLYISELESQVAMLRKQAQPVQEIRDQMRNREAAIQQLIDMKQTIVEQTYIWSRVTQSINGKAVLNRMTVTGNEVQLEGRAPSVENLIKTLESDPNISNVVIIGPVQATSDNKAQTMKIAMTVF